MKCAFKRPKNLLKNLSQGEVQSSSHATLNANTISLSLHAPPTRSGQFSLKRLKDARRVKNKKDVKHKISWTHVLQTQICIAAHARLALMQICNSR